MEWTAHVRFSEQGWNEVSEAAALGERTETGSPRRRIRNGTTRVDSSFVCMHFPAVVHRRTLAHVDGHD